MAQEKSQLISRRQLLQRTAGVGVAVAASGWMLAACSKEEEKKALSCTDTSGLDAQQLQTRTTLEYQEPAPKPDQHCANCRFFQSKGDNACGACTIVPGPINPKGWCKSWTAKTA